MDDERRKNSEETRSITNAGERDDYVSDRGWRMVQVLLGEPRKKTILQNSLFSVIFVPYYAKDIFIALVKVFLFGCVKFYEFLTCVG